MSANTECLLYLAAEHVEANADAVKVVWNRGRDEQRVDAFLVTIRGHVLSYRVLLMHGSER